MAAQEQAQEQVIEEFPLLKEQEIDKILCDPSKPPPKKRGRPPKEKTTVRKKTTPSSSTAGNSNGTSTKRKRYSTQKKVHDLLKKLGIEKPEEVNACLKEGIRKFHIQLLPPSEDSEGLHGLDQVITSGTCLVCGEYNIKATIRDVLYQDDVGHDYEDGAPDSKVRCPSDECCGYYISNMCTGTPQLDTGKFCNHCTMCPSFGRCINDYRNTHCPTCNKHYFASSFGGECYNCHRRSDSSDYGAMFNII